MNQGGEEGRDDYGLPRVDVEIPDDARELDRDVQAYHRELRALRRHQRSMRWRAPFRRSGIAVPLLAACLIAALLTVMISAMLTANFTFSRQQPAGQGDAAGQSSAAATPHRASTSPAGQATGAVSPPASRLPGTTISVAGRPLALRSLSSTALAIVPANCGCDNAVRELLKQARSAGVIVYLVGSRGANLAVLSRLAGVATGPKTTTTKVASDPENALTAAYRPVGLTVLLIDAHGGVTEAPRLHRGFDLERQLRLLRPAG